MPQELHVVKCFSCGMFQVHIVKKSPKWVCKMCGENQSLQQVFGKGSGKDCRCLVQELNRKSLDSSYDLQTETPLAENFQQPGVRSYKNSTWSKFTENNTSDVNVDTKDASMWSQFIQPCNDNAENINNPILKTGQFKFVKEENDIIDETANIKKQTNNIRSSWPALLEPTSNFPDNNLNETYDTKEYKASLNSSKIPTKKHHISQEDCESNNSISKKIKIFETNISDEMFNF